MRIDEFRDLLDAYGPDLSGWPAEERRAADMLLDASQEASAALREAEALHRLLGDALSQGSASTALRAAISQIPAKSPRMRQTRASGGWFCIFTRPWRFCFAAATASAVIGVAIGLASGPVPEEFERIDVPALVYGSGYDDEGFL